MIPNHIQKSAKVSQMAPKVRRLEPKAARGEPKEAKREPKEQACHAAPMPTWTRSPSPLLPMTRALILSPPPQVAALMALKHSKMPPHFAAAPPPPLWTPCIRYLHTHAIKLAVGGHTYALGAEQLNP